MSMQEMHTGVLERLNSCKCCTVQISYTKGSQMMRHIQPVGCRFDYRPHVCSSLMSIIISSKLGEQTSSSVWLPRVRMGVIKCITVVLL